jgi:hypothetical protein
LAGAAYAGFEGFVSENSDWDSYTPPSAHAGSPEEAADMIANGDFWDFEYTGTTHNENGEPVVGWFPHAHGVQPGKYQARDKSGGVTIKNADWHNAVPLMTLRDPNANTRFLGEEAQREYERMRESKKRQPIAESQPDRNGETPGEYYHPVSYSNTFGVWMMRFSLVGTLIIFLILYLGSH